jgi:Beta propeller domain
MVRRVSQLTALLALALFVTAGAGAFRRPLASQVQPRTFASCASLVSYAKGHFASTHGWPEPVLAAEATTSTLGTTAGNGVATPGVASAAASSSDVVGSSSSSGSSTSYSTTNDQEQGVDEPDIAKTDGSTIFTIASGTLEAVDVSGATERLAGSLDLGTNGANAQLLLYGDRLLVISTPPFAPYGGPLPAIPAALRASPYWAYGSQTVISEVDVSNPGSMAVTQTLTVNGRFVDARQSGGSARIVISSAPQAIVEPQLQGQSGGWVPTWKFHSLRTGRSYTRPVAGCSQIRRPVQFSGLGMLNILTVDYSTGLQAAQSTSLMADAQIVYGSTSALYIATQEWMNPELGVMQLPTSQQTVIDKFDVTDPDQTTYVASGLVPGYLLNQFSLSEAGGYLRVASTSRPVWWGPEPPTALSQSYVTVLQPQNGVLVPVGQVSGLGQGDQIYSVRFDGNTGYVVTYQQVDPLYTIDLSDPTSPKVAGQLDLQGYSAYLQPLGNGLLLGVGEDVSTTTNEPTGAQIELFDVSNPASPQLLAKTSLGAGSSSQVTYDHHAFLWWPATNLAVLPVQIYGYVTPITCPPTAMCVSPLEPASGAFTGAVGFTVTNSGIQELGQLVQDQVNGVTPTIERSIVVGSSLYTVSDEGVMQSNLNTLARQAFVSFPA